MKFFTNKKPSLLNRDWAPHTYYSNNCVSHQIVKKLYELNCRLIADKQEDDFEQGCGRSRYYALHE